MIILFQEELVHKAPHHINIRTQFDLHHGYGVLEKAITVMNEKDKSDFTEFVDRNTTYNPHIMFISKKKFLNNFFKDQFEWLFECEKIFGFENLKGYVQTRLYAFLAERYMPFWFRKYSKTIEWPWIFSDLSSFMKLDKIKFSKDKLNICQVP